MLNLFVKISKLVKSETWPNFRTFKINWNFHVLIAEIFFKQIVIPFTMTK